MYYFFIEKTKSKVLFFLAISLTFLVFKANAQESVIDKQFIEIQKKLRTSIDAYLTKINADESPKDLSALQPIFFYNPSPSNYDLSINLFDAQKRKIGKDKGIRLVGSYADNFNSVTTDELGYIYKRVFQTGLDWNLLNNGLRERKLNMKQCDLNSKISEIQDRQKQRNSSSLELSNNLVSYFMRYKIQKLKESLKLMNQQIDITKKIYYLKFITWEEVTELLSKKAEVENTIKNFSSQVRPTAFDTVNPVRLPIVDVNLDKLITLYKSNQINDSLAFLKSKSAYYANNTLREVTFKTSFRYNYYDSKLTIADRNFMTLGASLSIPFPLQGHINRQFTKIQKEQFSAESKDKTNSEINQLYSDYNDYKNKLKQYLRIYQTNALLQNKIRNEANKEALEDPSYSPIRIVSMISDLLASEIEMIDKEQALYLSLVNICNDLPDGDVGSFLELVNLEDFLPKKSADRRIYITYTSFKENENTFIYQYLRNNEIKGVLLAIGENMELKPKGEELIRMLRKDNVNVQLILTNPDFLNPQNPTALVNALANASKVAGVRGVHLDLDMFNYPDYIGNRPRYAANFLNMIKIAQIYLKDKNMRLSVSMPISYESGKLDSVFNYVDKVYLTAVDNKEGTFIKGKIQSKFAKQMDKIIVMLQTSNFYDRFTFEDYLEKLSKSSKLNNFAVNDFNGLLLLEERVFKNLDK